jgi:hypothetical protein
MAEEDIELLYEDDEENTNHDACDAEDPTEQREGEVQGISTEPIDLISTYWNYLLNFTQLLKERRPTQCSLPVH